MDFDLPPQHSSFRDAVRELAQGVALPLAAEVDRDHRFPEEAVKAAAEAGLMGVLIPREYGGAGLDALAFTLCIDELAQACASTSVIVDVHTSVGRDGLYVVFARTGPEERAAGVSAFLVPAETPGVRIGQMFKKMGLNGSPTGELVLEDVVVPLANRLAAEGQGFTVAMRALDSGRIGISGPALGIGQAAVDEATAVLRGRAREQGNDFTLADMATRLESARLLAYNAAWLCK